MTFREYLDFEGKIPTTSDLEYRKGIFRLLTKYYALDPEDLETLKNLTKKYCW